MKIVHVSELPKCDIDGCNVSAKYDAPTRNGQWANMCAKHYAEQGSDGSDLGNEFVQRTPAKPQATTKVAKGIEATDLEDIAYGEDREIGCPECGDLRTVEPDTHYTYVCEDCGTRVRVPYLPGM